MYTCCIGICTLPKLISIPVGVRLEAARARVILLRVLEERTDIACYQDITPTYLCTFKAHLSTVLSLPSGHVKYLMLIALIDVKGKQVLAQGFTTLGGFKFFNKVH
jgi:hypothetical protein